MRARVTRVTSLVIGAAAVAATIGCSSNSPTGPTAKSTAAHFDSLYVAAILGATHGDTLRSRVLSFLELAAGEGATPKAITVTTASGTQQWKALTINVADTSGSASASNVTYTIAYSDDNVTTAVLAEVTTGAGAQVLSEMVAADTIYVLRTTASASVSVTNTGACKMQTGLLNPVFGVLAADHCNLATFQTSLTATFPATPGVDASLTQVSFSGVASTGSRFTTATP